MVDDWDEDTTATDGIDAATMAKRRLASLTALTGGSTGKIFRVGKGRSLIGRAQKAEVRLMDDGVSRNHASVRFEGEDLWLDDMASRNGTFVNGERLTEPRRLVEGDKIQIGRTTVLRFGYHDEHDDNFTENLVSSALRDPLTRLFNKRYLLDRLDSELKFAQRHHTAVSLMLLDLDHFKVINDTYGHLTGDAVLNNLALVLQKTVRNEDVVARFGGEEFAIVLRAIPLDAAYQLAERLRIVIEKTSTTDQHGRSVVATASIGVAGYPAQKLETVTALIEAADQALYRAKREGRNRVARRSISPGPS
ncbi:MAG: GGDEF domain-containing protein [Proteobacteria bacterium]|nr:GGDEF domain-containing protein [Pseudomonadota bacterium]